MKKAFSLLIAFLTVFLIASITIVNIKTVNAAPQVTILSDTNYVDTEGTLHVVGEVKNTGTVTLKYIQVTATFVDASNATLGSSSSYCELDTIRVSEKSPFDILFTAQPSSVDHYSLTTSYMTGPELPAVLRILSNSSSIDGAGNLHVVGELSNNGSSLANYAEVIATLYDSSGRVVLESFAFTDPSDIRAGQQASFEIVFTETNRVSLVTSYALTAQSTQYSIVPEFPTSAVLSMLMLLSIVIGVFRLKHQR